MTSATSTTTDNNNSDNSKYEFYPEYCNAVSPTINKWCPLTAHDICGMSWKVRIENQKYIFFHLNHPIFWVRIVGVVVAIDSFYGRRIYTIDDSSGACIECCVTLPPAPDKPDNNNPNPLLPPPPPDPYPGIETGLVVDIKGSLTVFRNTPQIAVAKMVHLRSTGAEVAFWGKIRAFRDETLAKPWFVDADTARRLKRENEKDVVRKRRRQEQEKKQQRLAYSSGARMDRSSSHKKDSAAAAAVYDEERRRRKRSRMDEGATTTRDTTKDPRRSKREGEEHRSSSRREAVADAEQEKAILEKSERRSERHRDDGKKGWEGNPSLRHKPHRPSKLSEVATHTEGQYDALGL
ncbi:Protein stn1 [Apiospora saccharicola]|uniref:Protein stn1 n=1 Tax=Apiospora saccharicola TaxID=335842 RepID=A0ABR1U1W0_9PEZI